MRLSYLLLSVLLLAFSGCSKDGSAEKKNKKKFLSPRIGVWRSLKLMEASLNHKNYKGYLRVFGGAAAHELKKQLSPAKFRRSARGRYKLAAFHIVKRHTKTVVTVKYALKQFLSGKKPKIIKGEGIFSAAPRLKHYVMISFK